MRHRTVEERMEVVRRFRASTWSLAGFARMEGVSTSSLARWIARYGACMQPLHAPVVPVRVRPRLPEASAAQPPASSLSTSRAANSGVRLEVCGVSIAIDSGFDRAALEAVVEVLRQMPGRTA